MTNPDPAPIDYRRTATYLILARARRGYIRTDPYALLVSVPCIYLVTLPITPHWALFILIILNLIEGIRQVPRLKDMHRRLAAAMFDSP